MIVFASGTVISFLVLLQSHRTVGQPARSSTGHPAHPTTDQPAHLTTGQPAHSSMGQPAHATTGQPAHATTNQPAPSTMGQSAHATTNQSAPSTMGQPAHATTGQPGLSTMGQPADSTTVQPALSTMGQPAHATTNQSAPSTMGQPASSTTLGLANPCEFCCNSVANLTAVIDQLVTQLGRQEQVLEETIRIIIGNISSQLERQERALEETKRDIIGNISSQLEGQAVALELARQTIVNGSVSQLRVDSVQSIFLANITSFLIEQGDDLNGLRSAVADVSAQQKNISQVLQAEYDRGKAQDKLDELQGQLIKEIHDELLAPKDCMDIKETGKTNNGVYCVSVGGREVEVFCDMKTSDCGWLVFQRRKIGSVDFQRKWTEYAAGFGDLKGEFWLGNEILHELTKKKKYMLRVELENFKGEKRFAQYSSFSVASAADYYRLTVGGYSGNAGDSLSPHNGQQFSTKDVDRDSWTTGSCAQQYCGAWWYKECHYSNLNGKYLGGDHESYADGIEWYGWQGFHYSQKATEMKIAPLE